MTRKTHPHHVSLYLDPQRYRQLRQLVKNTGVDASKLLRAAFDLYVEERTGSRKRKPSAHESALPTGERLPIFAIWSE